MMLSVIYAAFAFDQFVLYIQFGDCTKLFDNIILISLKILYANIECTASHISCNCIDRIGPVTFFEFMIYFILGFIIKYKSYFSSFNGFHNNKK